MTWRLDLSQDTYLGVQLFSLLAGLHTAAAAGVHEDEGVQEPYVISGIV